MDKAGYGLIETMRVREERIPFLDRHLARLGRSLGELGLPKPSQDVPALVRPFAATGDAVLRVEVRDGRASVTVRELPSLARSEEHTSELQSRLHLVCRLLLEKKKKRHTSTDVIQ